jgi:YidC/Oxa1 family membrane protein insertase
MELQRTRLIFMVILFVIGVLLYGAWLREHPQPTISKEEMLFEEKARAGDVPSLSTGEVVPFQQEEGRPIAQQEVISIQTDVLSLSIDLKGGDIVGAELTQYPVSLENQEEGVKLLSQTLGHYYIAQSGLVGARNDGPDSREKGRGLYATSQKAYQLEENKDILNVDLHWKGEDGIEVTKQYRFTRGSYLVEVIYQIQNKTQMPWQGHFYGQIQKQHEKNKSNGMVGAQSYQGGALYTPDKRYKKISFSDMKKNPFKQNIEGGWVAMVERYFLCAYIPPKDTMNHFFTRVDEGNKYNLGVIQSVNVAPKASETVKGAFYIGPEITDNLKAIADGLNLTIDYGILWPISQLLFWLLKTIHQFVGNWGWSIILVTALIKAAFYKLSASSYRSMNKMRQLQPKIEALKEKYAEDKTQLSGAMMTLYREEKMNPLGGCLPILIQIPVFIALYYVLLESVELRQAPFMFWIQDLSSKDPYYILPLIMGATMFLQQKLNPPVPDPIQAKVMMLMPVIFTVLFLSFPAGLVLYWTANNILSVLQQWSMMRRFAVNR